MARKREIHRAARLVRGPRARTHGPAWITFRQIGCMWGALLDRDPIPPRMVAHMMSIVKMVRDSWHPCDEHLTDIHGYTILARDV